MPRAFSESEKEIIRQQLIEQGYKQFSSFGLKKTNIDELAAAVGISKGAFYIFYASKEALFMDVAEKAETHFRQVVLAVLDEPAVSPRAHLFAVLKKAFSAWKSMPILQQFSGMDVEVLLRRIPEAKMREHMQADAVFMQDLITRCRAVNIPIQCSVADLSALIYSLLLVSLNETALGPIKVEDSLDILIELVAAYCLGEINLQAASSQGRRPGFDVEVQHVLVN
jgi:AcrR family transcriptional regulator